MDIPNSGAIFTLGKSHLADNTQSYFYIKKDPVKRLISGPHQSAVICESGRLFVWGENHYGQLGIGHIHGSGKNSTDDIITKPTCVKALKSLGLKVCDAAYGNNWTVILTHSNEIFYSGQSIFPPNTHVAQHFTTVSIDNAEYAIIRKPFRLEEFDDYLSKSEETDNFVSILAGNEHFAVLTSSGRLIGCGSNSELQLGNLEAEYDGHPVEITLDAPVQQFVCGPECTLVLTESGALFLTGRLHEFVFPKFTELQKNLSPTEQIIYMHISKTSEIYIVTNVGSIYRSMESLRNKSLVFQRFYDYDSEENGPIWKVLKGLSFYAVLSKANKFFTTFSESGHHLKTFREISKFKNLRLLDIAVGDHHILVHGIPRSSTLSATLGPSGEHRFMSQSFVLQSPTTTAATTTTDVIKNLATERIDSNKNHITPNVINNVENLMGVSSNTKEQITNEDIKYKEKPNDEEENKSPMKEKTAYETNTTNKDLEGNIIQKESIHNDNSFEPLKKLTPMTSPTRKDNRSPLGSLSSEKSMRSIKFDAISTLKRTPPSSANSEKTLRPYTPYPENGNSSTPRTMQIKSMRNFSYEAAMQQNELDRPSSDLLNTLDAVTEDVHAIYSHENESQPFISTPTAPPDEDEHLAVEISTFKDTLDQSKTVNEIRFINNGVDVTQKVEEFMSETPLINSSDDIESPSTVSELHLAKNEIIDTAKEEVQQINNDTKNIGTKIEEKLLETRDSMQSTVRGAAIGARDAVDTIGTNAKRIASDALRSVEEAGNNAAKVASNAATNAAKTADETKESIKQAVGTVSTRISADIKDAKEGISTRLSNEIQDAKQNITGLFQSKPLKETPVNIPEPTYKDDELSLKDTIGNKTNTTNWREDDERTTASVNSTHSVSGNPFETNAADTNHHSGRITEPANYVDDLDAVVERSKKAMQDDLRAREQQVLRPMQNTIEQEHAQAKGRVRQFFDDVRAKGLSCKSEKAIQVDDEPQLLQPHHTNNKIDSEISLHNGYNQNNGNQSSSRVCTIL